MTTRCRIQIQESLDGIKARFSSFRKVGIRKTRLNGGVSLELFVAGGRAGGAGIITGSERFLLEVVEEFELDLADVTHHAKVSPLDREHCFFCNCERDTVKVVKNGTFKVCSFCGTIIEREL